MAAQGRSTDEIIFRSPWGLFGSWTGILVLILIVIGEVWVSIWPIEVLLMYSNSGKLFILTFDDCDVGRIQDLSPFMEYALGQIRRY